MKNTTGINTDPEVVPMSLTEETFGQGLHFLSDRDPGLAQILTKFGPPPMWLREPGFPTLIHIILEQQVSLASARAAYDRLREAASPLTAVRFLELGDATLKDIGFSRQKTVYGRNLAEALIPFDLDKNSLNCHFFIADSSGKSVVLEYVQDQWRKISGDKSWRVLTNKPVYNVSDEKLKKKCWRYRSISGTLERAKGNVDWKAGLKILQDVEQKGTTWSVIYSPPTKELYFSVYQKWDIIYHLGTF